VIHVADVLPDVDELAEAHRERLAERAADRLRQRPELQRAASMESNGKDYHVGVAVRMAGGIATACLSVPTGDPFALLAAFDRHAEAA